MNSVSKPDTQLVKARNLVPGDTLVRRDGSVDDITEVWHDYGKVWLQTWSGDCGYTEGPDVLYRIYKR